MVTYLDRIVAAHREVAERDDRDLDALIASASAAGPTRGFRRALAADEEIGVIAEVKRRSPSKGELDAGLDPAGLAADYAAGGACGLSVLTDAEFFGGSADDLRSARAACELPVLRKDFTVSPRDVCDAALMGADAVLLIAAALSDVELRELHGLAVRLGLDALVEIHDEEELARAMAVDAELVGVNQRDLVTFEVDQDRAERMGRLIPPGVVRVAESGVRGPRDAAVLAEAGYDALLVGELLVTSTDPAGTIRALRAAI